MYIYHYCVSKIVLALQINEYKIVKMEAEHEKNARLEAVT